LNADELDAALRASHLPSGANLFSKEVSSLADRLSAQAFVAEVKVARRIPPGVSVYVTPRTPFAVALIAGRHWELDRGGTVIRRSLPSRGLPLIEQAASVSPMPGERIGDETFLRAMEIARMLGRKGDPEFTKIVVDQRAHLCLNMSDGLIIRLGLAESLNQKVALIRKIYREQPNPADLLKSVDLTAPGHPVCVPRPESEKRKNESA
jgi:cell division septal protein FtsQ